MELLRHHGITGFSKASPHFHRISTTFNPSSTLYGPSYCPKKVADLTLKMTKQSMVDWTSGSHPYLIGIWLWVKMLVPKEWIRLQTQKDMVCLEVGFSYGNFHMAKNIIVQGIPHACPSWSSWSALRKKLAESCMVTLRRSPENLSTLVEENGSIGKPVGSWSTINASSTIQHQRWC